MKTISAKDTLEIISKQWCSDERTKETVRTR